MYNYQLHQKIGIGLQKASLKTDTTNLSFYSRFIANISSIHSLFSELYGIHQNADALFDSLVDTIIDAHKNRSEQLNDIDNLKSEKGNWFLSNELAGMSLYVDRFCGTLNNLATKLDYLKKMGINVLHLMPFFESPLGESDGGYAVSHFRKPDKRYGTLPDLEKLRERMSDENMYLMLDIVLNHTSHKHEWAAKAKAGDKKYQDFFYMYDDRNIPDEFEKTMPEIFPENAPGNFTYNSESNKWVMTVFHNYQWDLNYANPDVFITMMDTIFFYANLGVDILRIDAPAFIWKQLGTTCQNLSQAHTILSLIKLCVEVATPGMALLGEAIVAPKEIMNYFGSGIYKAKECDFAYNATQMALQWDALATGETKVMLAAQPILSQKPFGTSWITYTRCHDDIGLGYEDNMIEKAGFNAYEHRNFLKNYYSGNFIDSVSKGALFSYNPKNGDARISGTLASLCGLEKAIEEKNEEDINTSINKILLMQSFSCFIGGLPMVFYGDEVGYTNDYSFLNDEGKRYDNRWMHRPLIDWEKNKNIERKGTVEERIFSATKKLLSKRKKLPQVADLSNVTWLTPHNVHVAGFIRSKENKRLLCLYNFSNKPSSVTWFVFRENKFSYKLYDHWSGKNYKVGSDDEYLMIEPYQFCLIEEMP
jgi:amylosucrase